MADLKKSFDEVKEAATGLTSGNIMTSLQKDVGDALQIDDIDKPARYGRRRADRLRDRRAGDANDAGRSRRRRPSSRPRPMRRPPSRWRSPVKSSRAPQDITPPAADVLKDAKAS